ncbi:MAG: hypothetical protein BroJett011_49930 [Chloroflexota bacterium]|nr:MAG: hypothetical protein BroJett011_49930 [Chloroflexota bacterium]
MDSSPKRRRKLTPEQIFLFLGIFGFIVFIWIMAFLFLPLLAHRPVPAALAPVLIVEMAATRGFVLPPTWTPTPSREIIPTATSTLAYDGLVPTRMYTPRPTSLPGLPLPLQVPKLSVLDLARIMQGESPGDKEAAYMVGWVAKNRLVHPSYGDTYAVVSHGFFGYRPDLTPSKEFMDIARRIIKSREDPTGGCLYALSRTDITKLRIPPSRADVAFGEWFFFKTWPLADRGL